MCTICLDLEGFFGHDSVELGDCNCETYACLVSNAEDGLSSSGMPELAIENNKLSLS